MNYVVNISKETGQYHEIHRDDCSNHPLPWERLSVGSFISDKDAFEKTLKEFPDSVSCQNCML